MSSILFRELEILELPDGSKYEVRPIDTEKMELVWDYEDVIKKMNAIGEKEEIETEEQKQELETRKNRFMTKTLFPINKKLIQKGIINLDTGKPLPAKYINGSNILGLVNKVLDATSGRNIQEGETPLESPEKRQSDEEMSE